MFVMSEQEIRESKKKIATAIERGYNDNRKELLEIANSQILLKSYKVLIDEYLIKLKGLKEEFVDKLDMEELDLLEFIKK